MHRRLVAPALVSLLTLAASACAVPYAVGSTAETIPPGELAQSAGFQFAAGQPALDEGDDGGRTTAVSLDNEVRFGLDPVSDAGVRLVGLGGVVASYKRRLGTLGPANLAGIAGAGVIALGSHAHLEGTLVASGPPRDGVAPYGGVRAQALLPLAGAAEVPLTLGVFGGLRLARGELAVHPELGLFYVPTELLGESDWVVVPSLTVHGDDLLRALGVGF